jgi:hypothetical protein
MKNLILFLTFLLPVSGFAQPYYIDWHKVSGGGGTSTNASSGGGFSVSGTIGQHDAGGPLTNNSYVIYSGFWSLLAIQTPGAPALSISLVANSEAMVYWPYPSIGYALQVNTNLATTNWTAPAQTVTNNGVVNYILVNPPAGQSFYRLVYP